MRLADTWERQRTMLRTAFGPVIGGALADPLVIEVMVNPDGTIRLERLGMGCGDTGHRLEPPETERIIRIVASQCLAKVRSGTPIVSAELPPHGANAGERFEGLLPPVSTAPCFAIRKPAGQVHTLADYVNDGLMRPEIARTLSLAVVEKRNILVAGGASSGKTMLATALLTELTGSEERVILIEDTRELQCPAADCIALRTRPGLVNMADLLRSSLRLRPDRLIVGEVRGAETLDMLKAWNTGQPGGIATVHAHSLHAALHRIEQLVQERVPVLPRSLIAEAIDLVVFIDGQGTDRRIDALAELAGVTAKGEYILEPITFDQNEGEVRNA